MVTARPALGFDTGVSFDRSAVALVFRLAGIKRLNPKHDGRPVFIAFPYVFPQATPLRQVVDTVLSWPIPFHHISAETNGVGAMPAQELRHGLWGRPGRGRIWNFVHTTAATKTAAYGTVLGLLENQQLVLPRNADLLRQLAGLKFEQGERGFMRIEAESAVVHDDVADALMLAMGPRPRNHRVDCSLAACANPRRCWAEAEIPTTYDGEVVETGNGLRLFARPPLQSVDGPELWLPPSVAKKPESASGRFIIDPFKEGLK